MRIDSASSKFQVSEIKVFGYGSSGGMVTGAFEPTEAPLPTVTPYPDTNVKENVPPTLVENNQGT